MNKNYLRTENEKNGPKGSLTNQSVYKNNKDEFTKYTKVIYYEARLIEGLPVSNPTELSSLVCEILSK